MKTFLKMVLLGITFGLTCAAYQVDAQTISSSASLDEYIRARFGDAFKILGPATIVPASARLELNPRAFPATVVSVPVAYIGTARLGQDLIYTVGSEAKTVTVPKDTPLFLETFRRSDTDIFSAWCFVSSYHAFAGTFYYNNCIGKTPEGKAVVYYDPGYSYDLGVTSMYDPRGEQGTHGMYWYAFSLAPEGAAPVDYPVIDDVDVPSPQMSLELRVQVARFGNADPYFLSYWALKGPKGFRPGAGILAEQWIQYNGKTLSLDIGKTDIRFDYDPKQKVIENIHLDASADAPKCTD